MFFISLHIGSVNMIMLDMCVQKVFKKLTVVVIWSHYLVNLPEVTKAEMGK